MVTRRTSTRSVAPLALALLGACATRPPSAEPTPREGRELPSAPLVRHWGGMREVLREGRTEGRVSLEEVLGPRTVAVGAAAGLAAEITVVDGAVHLAEVLDARSPQGLRVRAPAAGEQACLLVLADVAAWSEHPLGAVADLPALEAAVRDRAAAEGIDVTEPFPFRVAGVSSALRLHVLDRSCPIAAPDGPQPWRFAGEEQAVVLVGFHAVGSGGVLTHHGQASHTHAVLPARGVSGHLDAVSFRSGARLFLPAR